MAHLWAATESEGVRVYVCVCVSEMKNEPLIDAEADTKSDSCRLCKLRLPALIDSQLIDHRTDLCTNSSAWQHKIRAWFLY